MIALTNTSRCRCLCPSHHVRARANDNGDRLESLKLFVRSSGVALNGETHDQGVGGEVVDVAFTGRGYEHVVSVGEGATLTKIFSTRRFERAAHVKVSFDPSECFVMNAREEEE